MKIAIKIENLYIKCSNDNQLSEYILNSESRTYDLLPIHEQCDLCKCWEIIDTISEMVQDRDIVAMEE